MTHHHHHPGREPWHDLPEAFIDRLELESLLNESVRRETLEQAALTLRTPPSTIIDIGSGTGSDAVALAERFPTARIHALDVSAELLERVESAAAASGLADQIVSHRVDLNDDWPKEAPQAVDLAWAALSLHHLSDPAAVLQRVLTTLKPGGVFVLTELTGPGVFTPSDLGSGRTSLQERMTHGSSAHSAHRTRDWSKLLEQAGFTAVEYQEKEFSARADTIDGARYLEMQLRAQRERLAPDLSAENLAVIDAAIHAVTTGKSEISFSAGRGVWIAARPQPTISTPPVTPGTREFSEVGTEGHSTLSLPRSFEADVAVVGGGVAGLAAAIALARSRRRVVMVDTGEPRNAPAIGAHNVLGQEGVAPVELVARGRTEAISYGVRIIPGHATNVAGQIDDFNVEVNHGSHHIHTRRIILATGLVDDLPDIPGIDAGWGRTVLHCPFCHGWEVRDQHIAILIRDEVTIHQAMLFAQLSDRVTMFLHEAPDPSEEQREQLAALGIEVVRPRVERLLMDGPVVQGIEIADGRTLEVDAVVVTPRFNSRTELYELLGGAAESTPFGRQIPTAPNGLTDVPGVWAAGNASQIMAMVTASAASGTMAGAAVHGDLSLTELNRAVEARRTKSR